LAPVRLRQSEMPESEKLTPNTNGPEKFLDAFNLYDYVGNLTEGI